MSWTDGINDEKFAGHDQATIEHYANCLEEQVAWLRGEVDRKNTLIELLVSKLCETVDPEEEDEPANARRTL